MVASFGPQSGPSTHRPHDLPIVTAKPLFGELPREVGEQTIEARGARG